MRRRTASRARTSTSKNTNINTLKTGDVVNLNANENKQIQSFGVPFVRALTPR
jgi:hypothetical protein